MNSRHFLLRISILCLPVLPAILLVGCAGQQKHTSTMPADEMRDKPPSLTTRPDGMDAATQNPADILAQRTQEYSRAIEPMIPQHPVSGLPNQPSIVQWDDSNQLRLSNSVPHQPVKPQIVPQPPPPANVESSGMAANQPLTAVPPAAAPAPKPAEPVMASQIIPPSTPVFSAVTEESADAMSEKLSRRVREYPHDVSGQLDYQLLQFLLDQPVPNLTSMNALPGEDRELVAAVVDGLSNFRNNLRADSNMLLSHKVKPLLDMADRLRAQAELNIPTVELCTSVRGFGNYDLWQGEPPRFSAGMDHPVIMYCEVQNFSSQLDANKLWQTQLTQDAVLYTENGMSVWNDKSQTINDGCRNRRQDFFVVQRLKLPGTLPIGRYLLKVTIQDTQAKRMAEKTVPILVVAQ